MTIGSLKQAQEASGKVSVRNSKMPGSTFAADPRACPAGSKLRQIKGTSCNSCYACKLVAIRPTVAKGYASNQDFMVNAPFETFVEGMVFQITKAALKTGEAYHRWFDAGDLASYDVLCRIGEVAKRTPHIQHWLPTQEAGLVRKYVQQNETFPTIMADAEEDAEWDPDAELMVEWLKEIEAAPEN